MVAIRVHQLLIDSALHKHIFMENIKKLYRSAGKYNYQ